MNKFIYRFKLWIVMGITILFVSNLSSEQLEHQPFRVKWSNLEENDVTGYYLYWRRTYENFSNYRRTYIKRPLTLKEVEFDLRTILVYLYDGHYFFAVSAIDNNKNEGALSLEAYYRICSHPYDQRFDK